MIEKIKCWREDVDMRKGCINNARLYLIFDKLFEIIYYIFAIAIFYVVAYLITDITLKEQIFFYEFIVVIFIATWFVGRMHARMIYKIKIEDNKIICYCGCYTKRIEFENEDLESIIETADKYIFKISNEKKYGQIKSIFDQ